MIYFDTSALVKLIFEENESHALSVWLATQPYTPKISCDLSIIELMRTCRRVDARSIPDAIDLLEGIDLLPLDRQLVERAARIEPSNLRSLDAIHLASAMSVKDDLTAFVAYDDQLRIAAIAVGLEVVTPTE